MASMHINQFRALIAGAAFALSGMGIASAETSATPAPIHSSTPIAQATPAPASLKGPSQPNPLSYSGFVRGYYFTRLNNPQLTSKNALNQASYSTAFDLHGTYAISKNWTLGATYLYATPFTNNCDTSAQYAKGAPCVKPNKQALIQGTNADNTLAAFNMSTLYEAYLQYKDNSFYGKIGNQLINLPWAPTSDSRLKPAAFLGADFVAAIDKNWTIEGSYMNKFESRASSDFLSSTLLTATNIPDAPGAGSNLHIAPFSSIYTPGFYYANAGYKQGAFLLNVGDYAFVNIANAIWANGQYNLPGAYKPFIAAQFGNETNTGSSVIGKINSQVFGIQGGITPWNNITFTVGYNYIPEKSDTVTLPANVTCSATGSIGGSAVFPYFLPSGGTPQCHNNGNGTATVYYGGWASPYTDSYATDPFYTTSISQGMADRRSPGQGVKVAMTTYLFQKRIRLIASRAYYSYGNATAGVAPTQENNLDGTYYFNPLGKGAYHGLSFRYRYAERTQNFFTTNPDFKYNRAQMEYDF
jgi:hypothetical protein